MLGHTEALHALSSEAVRRAVAEGVPACPRRRPDAALGKLE
ncbi:hypothetical protein ACIQU4_17650 [Streptomyces sp. NPDC090741]